MINDTTIRAIKDLISSLNSIKEENLDNKRFILFIIPYIKQLNKMLEEDI